MTNSLDSFQTALLADLREYVAARATDPSLAPDQIPTPDRLPAREAAAPPVRRPARRSRAAWLAAAAVAGATTGALWWSGAGAGAAFAVERAPSGDVTVTVLRAQDAAGLRSALAAQGITADVTYLPWGQGCAPGRFTQASPATTDRPWAMGGHGNGNGNGNGNGLTFTVPAGAVRPGQTLVLELSSTERSGAVAVVGRQVAVAQGPVGTCVPVPVTVEDPAAGPASAVG